jgi:hypothetical protein
MKGFLKHISPAAASICVWIIKLLNLNLSGKLTRVDILDVLIWALVSLLTSCCWRVCTDDRTLATARPADSGMTRILLYSERFVCVALLGLMLYVSGAGAKVCVNTWLAKAVYFSYGMFPLYLIVGYAIYRQFNNDRQLIL